MKNILAICLLIPLFLMGQKNYPDIKSQVSQSMQAIQNRQAKATFNTGNISLTDEDGSIMVRTFIKKTFSEIQGTQDDIILVHANQSRIGFHYQFQQTFKGIRVYAATFNISINPLGYILSSFNSLIDSKGFNEDNFIPNSTLGEAVYLFSSGGLIPTYRKTSSVFELFYDVNGNEIFKRDIRLGFQNEDTIVSGKVFLPDPLSSQQVIYGQNGTYQHFCDSDYALLNDQRKLVTFPASFANDSFYLENRYERIIDLGVPVTSQVKSKQPMFDFTRKKDAFKDLNAFYHIYATQMFYQSIGFNNLKNYQLKFDAQIQSLGDNSYFNPLDTTLNFGTGIGTELCNNIPDAEDGDIPTHEYTHVLSWFLNPTENMSTERRATEEGMCDVIAAIRSKKYTTFNWRKLFNFDGPNPISPGVQGFWGGRQADSKKTYDNKVGDWYGDSEIWSSTILDISDQIGTDSTAAIMLTTIYSMPSDVTMPQAAILFMQADSILHGKSNSWKIGPVFTARKLGNYPTGVYDFGTNNEKIRILNTSGFALGTADATIEVTTPSIVTIFNTEGKLLFRNDVPSITIGISPNEFRQGIYFIRVENSEGINFAKITRF